MSLLSALNALRYHKPDFLVLGAQKAGTTALYDYLSKHPQILPAKRKEVHFFDYQFYKTYRWYLRRFPTRFQIARHRKMLRQNVISGEASPCYLVFPDVPERVHSVVPHAKFIVLLRNPVDRAFSHYQMNRSKGEFLDPGMTESLLREPLSFEEAIAQEESRVREALQQMKRNPNDRGRCFQLQTYQTRGLYAQQLKAWFKIFPREQFLILESSDFFQNTDSAFNRVLEFLEIQPLHLPHYEAKLVGGYQDTMKPETRAQLIEYFRPHNEELYELLGRRFDWNK